MDANLTTAFLLKRIEQLEEELKQKNEFIRKLQTVNVELTRAVNDLD